MPIRTPLLSSRLKTWGMVSLVFGLVLICYWPALRGAMLWDDPAHVTRPELRSWTGLGRIWTDLHATQQYYPVLFSAFWVEHRLWGDSTLGYHLVNLLLHATSCCLLAVLLRRLWSAPAGGAAAADSRGVPAGAEWFAAILFAVHPVCVESVAWISEQKNTLSLVFYLLAGLVYLDFAARRRSRSYAWASVWFLLALGSKSVTATLPAALLVVLWWKNGKLTWRREVAPLLPWFLVAIGSGLFTAWVERRLIGAEGVRFALSTVQRVLLAGRVIWFYLGRLFWPVDQAFFYIRWDVAAAAAGWVGYLAAAVAVTAGLWIIRRRSRGPLSRAATAGLAGWLLFVGSLFPALGFFNVYPFVFSFVADHFQYLASISLIAAAAAGIALGLAGLPPWLRGAGRAACCAVILLFAWLANRQSRLYVNNETLFRATIARNPSSWMAHHILAVTLSRAPDRHAEAIAEYEEALRLNPDYPDVHLGLGVELARLPGRKSDAIAEYERAVQLRPRYVEAHNNLGLELARLPGRTAEAIAHYETALRLKPDFAEAHANLGDALAQLPGRQAEAVAHYEAALRIKPGLAWAHCHLAFVLSRTPGRETEAIAHSEEALRLKPDYVDAYNALAITYVQLGRPDQAKAQWEAALKIDPANETIQQNLQLLRQMGER
jgi:tetratricopeptide (TPR) repeat protein